MFEDLKIRIALQKKMGLYRRPPIIENRQGRFVDIGGERFINFASNDYLALSQDRKLKEAFSQAIMEMGTSSSSSRLVSANYRAMEEVEKQYSQYFGYESCLFFPSGFQANLAVVSSLSSNWKVFVDKHVHASTVCGLRMGGVRFNSYKHGDMLHLRKRISSCRGGPPIILTEALFSMDGDVLCVDEIRRIKQEFDAGLFVDEAHSFGVLGEKGRGVSWKVADVATGTLGKAFGFFGAFVLMSGLMREYLFNFSYPLIYSTALPPAHARGALCALERICLVEDRRWYLQELADHTRELLRREGLEAGGDAQIIWIKIGDEKKVIQVCRSLREKGFLVFGARYPTVAMGRALIRLSLCYFHSEKDVERLICSLKDILLKIQGQ